ncbi:protein kinase family protein [Paracidovorax oryzae]|uniref:protein kinase family protein n=1 Tax=Paracidovorax oryzae TaxID=862720 RepID=UPI000A01BDF1|nr:protein kinase family protein [Paracidovorax oryzae]
MERRKVKFQHGRSFFLERELGRGACGLTVLLHDEAIDEYFVCKKYSPAQDAWREQFFAGFLREIKLMHAVHHVNVVRVFNYIIYPESFNGFIFMEYIDGLDIDNYLKAHPEDINSLFIQVVEGFDHLENKRILHRDIRTSNILVSGGGIVKIIDFGFGKQALNSTDFDKSISLNWWCALPPEFAQRIYDHATEIYFVGKLFEWLIEKHEIVQFRHEVVLRRMVEPNREKRFKSFAVARQELIGQPRSTQFSQDDIECYRWFSRMLAERTAKVGTKATCFNIEEIHLKLEEAYKSIMLEPEAPSSSIVIECCIDGLYSYYSQETFPVQCVQEFIELLRKCSKEQKNIIEANLRARIDALPKIKESQSSFDDMDDIPF